MKTTYGASNVYECKLANLQSMPVLIFGRSGEMVEAFIKGVVVVVVLFIIVDEVVFAESVTSTIVAVAWVVVEFVVPDVFGNTVVVLIIAAVDVGFLVVIVLVCVEVLIVCVVVFVFDGDAILCVVVVDTNVLDAVLVLVLSAG